MSSFIQFSLIIIIIIFAAKTAGLLSVKLGQPSVMGEIIIGIIIGPTVINVLGFDMFSHAEEIEHTITELGEVGVMLLMFLAGLELHLSELRHNVKVAAWAGTLGVIFPVMAGWLIGIFFGMSHAQAIFLGLVMGATSVSISAQCLMELKVLNSRVGLGLLGAAVLDDVLVIFLLSVFFAVVSGTGGFVEIGLTFVRMAVFFTLAFLFGAKVLPALIRFTKKLPISQNTLSLALVMIFAYGIAAELVGKMAAISGAFIAGLMFAQSTEKDILHQKISAMAFGFFVPIFFINIGLNTHIKIEQSTLVLAAVVTIVAVLSKLMGSAIGSKVAGFNWRDSIRLGTGMISRGEVGLIIANVGLGANLMRESDFSVIVVMIIVSVLITPPALRILFNRNESAVSKSSA